MNEYNMLHIYIYRERERERELYVEPGTESNTYVNTSASAFLKVTI